jgi:hypothetical protein
MGSQLIYLPSLNTLSTLVPSRRSLHQALVLVVPVSVVLVFMPDGLFPPLSRNLTAPARTSPPPPPSCLSQRRDGRATNSMLMDQKKPVTYA